MRIPLLRTLSGRIVLGFTVLTITFGTISALIVFNMELLSREIRLIRTGYLPLALEARDLDEKQDILWSYIKDEVVDETRPGRAETMLIRHTQVRSLALRDIEQVLAELTQIPAAHRRQIAITRDVVGKLRDDIDALVPLYKELQASPPLKSREAGGGEAYAQGKRVLDELRQQESAIRARIKFLTRQHNDLAKLTALSLERNERNLRIFALYLGVTAVLVGLLITIWATMTLRPLKRLRDAAQRIAQGEYASRIEETGPVEVADLAREFNIMGRAIEERERELVRHERLVAVGQMAATITHEVRNPLSAIGLNTELLEEELYALGDAAEEARSLCRAITTEVDRLTAITEEYLQFARLPKPKLRLEEVNPVLRNLADFQRELLAVRNVELVTELAESLPRVQVDMAQLRQALLNLLRNAADALADKGGGRVVLASRLAVSRRVGGEGGAGGSGAGGSGAGGSGAGGEVIELSVTDDGPGIPEDLVPKLFEPFVSTKDKGTGLGLALTQQIIREHGGDLRVESRLGEGATFIIALPVDRDQDAAKA